MLQDLQSKLDQVVRSAQNNFNKNMQGFRSEMNSMKLPTDVPEVLRNLVSRITNR